MGDARETLARVADGAPGWVMDADSHARFATLAHEDGAVVELRREREGEPWVCDAGRPGAMQRRQHARAVYAVLLGTGPGSDVAPEVYPLHLAAGELVHIDYISRTEGKP